MSANWNDLVVLLAGAPSLPGANCRNRSALFDDAATGEPDHTVHQRHTQALSLCGQCPALDRCSDWLDGLPRVKQPYGVIAGRVRSHRPGRQRTVPA